MTSTPITTPGSAAVARSARAPRIGAGETVVLYTSSDCWRGAGVSYVGIARGLDAHGFRPRVVTTCDEVTHEFAAANVPVTQLPLGRGESWRLRRFLRQSAADVVLSWLARRRVLRDTPFMRRVAPVTIHEGVDATLFRPCACAAADFRRSAALGAAPFLLAVGALSPEKRYDLLFDALRLLGERAPTLVVFGEGPDEARLRERADALRLSVRFNGRVSQTQLVGAYNACSGLVHAGSVETFGLAVLEAMACGRPVIASAGGALPEVIGTDGSCGTLVPPDSAWEMAGAIRRLLVDPANAARVGARARDRAHQRFSLKAMERAYAHFVARYTGYNLHRTIE